MDVACERARQQQTDARRCRSRSNSISFTRSRSHAISLYLSLDITMGDVKDILNLPQASGLKKSKKKQKKRPSIKDRRPRTLARWLDRSRYLDGTRRITSSIYRCSWRQQGGL